MFFIYIPLKSLLGKSSLSFEDITKGIEAAAEGGFQTVAVFDKAAAAEWDENKEKANYFITDFEEMLQPGAFVI